jgi:hypothetical protein
MVDLPAGWKAERLTEGPIVIRSPQSSSFALVQPFIARRGETAEGVLKRAPAEIAALFPNAVIVQTWQRGLEGNATAEIRFGEKQAMKAHMQCSIYNRGGMLYAVAAPQASFDRDRPALVKALGSFQFTPSSADAKKPAEPTIEYVTWREPNEGAFTIEVPKGWSVSGGIVRKASVDVRTAVEIASPDGRIRIYNGDARVGGFAKPNALLSAGGFGEGSVYSPGYGVSMIVKRYQPGAVFAADNVAKRFGGALQELRISKGRQRPDLTARLNELFSGFAAGVNVRADAGDVEFTAMRNGEPIKGSCFASTVLAEMNGSGTWSAPMLYGYVASSDQADTAATVLAHMVGSFKSDEEWARRQGDLTMRTSGIVTQANQEIMDIWRSARVNGGGEGEHPFDRMDRLWGNVNRGQETVRDPETGETWQAEAGHNYYFARPGSTEVKGNDTGEKPNASYGELVIVR